MRPTKITAVFFFYILKIFAISLEHISNATFINNTFILYRLPDDCKCTCSNVDTNAEFASKQLNLTRGTKKGDKSSTESTTSEECGQFSMDGINSLNSINVSEARVHWPWSALVGVEGSSAANGIVHYRGLAGSVIGKRWILSSSFVFNYNKERGPGRFYVITGARDLYHIRTGGPMVSIYNVKNVTVHYNYWSHGYANASYCISLIELESDIVYNQYVQPICISSAKLDTLFSSEISRKLGQGTLLTGYLKNPDKSHNNTYYSNYDYWHKLSEWSVEDVTIMGRNSRMPTTFSFYDIGREYQFLRGTQMVRQNRSSGIWYQHGFVIADTKFYGSDLLDTAQFCDWIGENTRGEVACK